MHGLPQQLYTSSMMAKYFCDHNKRGHSFNYNLYKLRNVLPFAHVLGHKEGNIWL